MSTYSNHHPTLFSGAFGNSLLIALAVHGFLILSLNFKFSLHKVMSREQTLEITVVRPDQDQKEPEKVRFLAQATQEGGGNVDENEKPTVNDAMQGPYDLQTDEINQSEFSPPDKLSQVAKKETPPQLTVRTISTFKIVEIPPEELKKKNIPSPAELLANLQKKIQKMEAELDKKTRALAKIPRRTVISAATKEHLYADYMEDWRRKIERVGNMNYPSDATGDVILHMSIRANGTVEKLRIIHAADSSAINEAAMNIAQLAAPFAPFPKKIREKTDIIDIIRTWRFIREEQDIRVN